MNGQLRRLYTCSVNNKVVVFETNFKEFYSKLNNYIPKCNGDRWYANKFNTIGEFEQWIEGDLYYFQRLV